MNTNNRLCIISNYCNGKVMGCFIIPEPISEFPENIRDNLTKSYMDNLQKIGGHSPSYTEYVIEGMVISLVLPTYTFYSLDNFLNQFSIDFKLRERIIQMAKEIYLW